MRLTNIDIERVRSALAVDLGALLDPVGYREAAGLSPSLLTSRMVPMPSSLATYATMFYASSLVRYKPDRVDPRSNPVQAWLMDCFVDQAALPLLQSAASGITGTTHPALPAVLTEAPTVGAVDGLGRSSRAWYRRDGFGRRNR